MKNLSILLLCVLLIAGCEEEEASTTTGSNGNLLPQCLIDTSLVTNKDWQHLTGVLATLRFADGGAYFENNENDGNWEFSNGCDSIFITRPSNSFYYRVQSVSADTLVLVNPVFGFVTFYSE